MSPQNLHTLDETQKTANKGKKTGKIRRPKQDVVTRWTSTFTAMLRTTFLRVAYIMWFSTYDANSKFQNQLDQKDFAVIRMLCAVLQPFNQIITALQSRSKSTLAYSWLWIVSNGRQAAEPPSQVPAHDGLETDFEKRGEGDDVGEAAMMAGKVLDAEVKKRFPKTSLPMPVKKSMALDPRTKTLPGLSQKERDEVWKEISDKVKQLRTYMQENVVQVDLDEDEEVNNMNVDQSVSAMLNFMNTQDQEQISQPQTLVAVADRIDPEVALWRDTVPAHPITDVNFDVLEFWSSNAGQNFATTLHRVAYKYHGGQPTAAENERTFSHAGRLLTALRTLMAPSLVEDCMFVFRNIDILMVLKEDPKTGNLERVVDVDIVCAKYVEIFGRKAVTKQMRGSKVKEEKEREEEKRDGKEVDKGTGQENEADEGKGNNKGADTDKDKDKDKSVDEEDGVDSMYVDVEEMRTPQGSDDGEEDAQQPVADSTTPAMGKPLILELLKQHQKLAKEAVDFEAHIDEEEKMNSLFISLALDGADSHQYGDSETITPYDDVEYDELVDNLMMTDFKKAAQ